MSTTNLLLCAVLLFNTAAAAAYLIWGMLTARRTKKGKMLVFIRFFLMLFCPVIGILYFVCSMLFHKLLFHKKVDLSDVIFNKEKIRQVERSDLERERNIAPIEETIAVSDYKNQRQPVIGTFTLCNSRRNLCIQDTPCRILSGCLTFVRQRIAVNLIPATIRIVQNFLCHH